MSERLDLVDAVIKAATDIDGKKKLPCVKAFQLAERFEVEKLEIRRICDANEIKICNCQLGCFK